MAIGEKAFNGASLTNVTLAGTLVSLPTMAFKGSSITNVVLDLPNLVGIAADAFSGQQNVRSVELVSVLADMGLVTNVVVAAANNKNLGEGGYYVNGGWQKNDLRIFVSKKQWTPGAAETYSDANPAGFFLGADQFNAKEKAIIDADPTLEKAFGLLVVKSGTTVVRKAFFVHKPSLRDPKGLYIRIR